jgi:hypothetical protein
MKKPERKSGLRPAVGEGGLYAGGLSLSTPAPRKWRHFSQRTKYRRQPLPQSMDIVLHRGCFKGPFLIHIAPLVRSRHKADTFSRD